MLWIEFLNKVATDPQYQCKFTKTPRERFLRIFENEELESYSMKQATLAGKLGYDSLVFGRYLTEIYKALAPFFADRNFQLRTKDGRGRIAYQETQLCRVYGLLKTCYLEELDALARQEQATAKLIGLEEKLHQQLQEFNYFDDEASFKSKVNEDCCNAFLVRVNEEAAQKWLARRLTEKIPNFDCAKKIPLDLRNVLINDNLLMEIAQSVLDSTSPQDESAIIEEITEFCRHQVLIIALYRVRTLKKEDWECLKNFWEKLVQNLDQNHAGGRCTLLLLEDVDFECPIAMPNLYQLEPWEKVKKSHWRSWADRQEVQNLWRSCRGVDTGNVFSSHSDEPPDKPQVALERICLELRPKPIEHQTLLDEMKRTIWNLAA
jgi:hypothetical protein